MNVHLSILILTSFILSDAWQTLEDRRYSRNLRGDYHYHTKRHMLPREGEPRKRATSQRPKELRKKPSGHLTPLNEDDIENDEVVSVAVGPPAIRPKYDKLSKSNGKLVPSNINAGDNKASTLVKDVLLQLGRELLSRQVSEDFVFGQYLGMAMKNLTADLKLRMQHEILELIVKYQKKTEPQTTTTQPEDISTSTVYSEVKYKGELIEKEKKNDTDEGWPDFSNLAKIVG
ncbi:uncharacterized protein LOC125049649 [Pieris napi]|uniref:uncharacterized protein LOC125049649 n=1 Tax=Pieris napi TaxID=78633 RepID=UPI001FBBCE7B|nr:uncharacterized protein LOC125049649 [Pieris napi]